MEASGLPTIERVDLSAGSEALQLAAQAWPLSEREGQFAAAVQLRSQFVLLAARRDARLVGAILGQQLPGKAAIVWPPQVVDIDPIEAGLPLIQAMHGHLA